MSAVTPESSTSRSFYPATLACQAALVAMLGLALFGPAMQLYGASEGAQYSNFRQYGYIAILAVVLVAGQTWRRFGQNARAPWWMIVPLAWCWLSVLWSSEPSISVSKIAIVTIVFTVMFLVVDTIGFKRASLIFTAVLCGFVVLNLYYVFAAPDIGVFSYARDGQYGMWRGIMGDKNILGSLCGVTVVFLIWSSSLPLIARFVFLVPTFTLLVLSRSRTAMLMTVVALVLSGLVRWFARRRGAASERAIRIFDRIGYGVLALVALVFVYVAMNVMGALAVIDEPTGGANRFQIWQTMLLSYAHNPLSGSGFGAYWAKIDQNPDSYGYGQSWLMMVTQGHNGYLDAAVQVGLPGLLLILFAILIYPSRVLIRLFTQDPARFGMVLALLLFVLGSNMTETSIFERDTIGNVALAFALAIVWTSKKPRPRSRRRKRRSEPDPAA